MRVTGFFSQVGSNLVEEDDCNNFRKERGLQKASKGGFKKGESMES